VYAYLKRATHLFLDSSSPGDKAGMSFDYFMIALIVANVFAIILETVESICTISPEFFFWFEVVSVAFFTVEYVFRVWSCTEDPTRNFGHPVTGRLRFMASPMAMIDLLAFLPFYLAFFGIDLRMLRVIRLLRLLKLSRYSPALSVIGAVVMAQHRALTAALLVMLIALLFSSSILFILEQEWQPEKFASIPDAMWWSLATLTTVGYGDVTPITPLGRFFGAITMIIGIGMFALPTGVIATGFADEIRKRDFVVNWKLASNVPLFQPLDATQVAEVVSVLTPFWWCPAITPWCASATMPTRCFSSYPGPRGGAAAETVFLGSRRIFRRNGRLVRGPAQRLGGGADRLQSFGTAGRGFQAFAGVAPGHRNIAASGDRRAHQPIGIGEPGRTGIIEAGPNPGS
jgi:hypothetical protein